MIKLNFAGRLNCKLSENTDHNFASQHTLSIFKSNAVYTYIPKNACSTLRLSLAVANGVITDKDSQHDWIHKNNMTFSASLRELVSADYSFIVLRCPYRRIASTFLDKFVSLTNLSTRFVDSLASSFDILDLNFVRFLKIVRRQTEGNRDHHWKTQASFWVYEEYSDVFCVEKMENLNRTLREKKILEVVDARPFTQHSIQELQSNQSDCYSRTSIRVLSAMKRKGHLPLYENMYCDEAKALVEEIYAEDFSLYNKYLDKADLLFERV